MRVIKKINNNTALCVDGKGRELIAVGTGIGFPATPYELKDMNKVQSTFYNIQSNYLQMMDSIPAEVIEFTARLVDQARKTLPYELSPNLVLTLADHISFAIYRKRKGIHIRMPLAYDLEFTYPKEIKLAKQALQQIWKVFHLRLPESEASGICMGIVNARIYKKDSLDYNEVQDEQTMLDDITRIIEKEMGITLHRDSFNFARYITHMQYLIHRLHTGEMLDTINQDIYQNVRKEYEDTAHCVDMICLYLEKQWDFQVSEEEQLYVLLHVNRLCSIESM